MAEDGFVDIDDDNAFEWLYVEDDYPLADELAETQIPSPGFINAEHELAVISDFDPYEYFMDTEYGDNEYWDNSRTGASPTGEKRKRSAAAPKTAEKRRKLSSEYDNVVFVPMAERIRPRDRAPTDPKTLRPFALLPDWRTRFSKTSGEIEEKPMPVDMKKAAESKDSDVSPQALRRKDATETAGENEDEWEDEEEEPAEGAATEDLQAQLASLDPEMVKAILKQRMGDAGLEGMDEGAFMQTISKMLSGEGNADDAAGDLANSLLGQATAGNDSALTGWLSQQGVSLDEAKEGEEDEGEEIEVAQPSARAGRRVVKASPHDSAIGGSKGGRKQMAMHGSSPSSARKRSAPEEAQDASGSSKKRRVVSEVTGGVAAPRVEEKESITVGSAAPSELEDSIAVAPASSGNDDSIAVAQAKTSDTVADGAESENEGITVATSKKANTKAAKNNKATSKASKPDTAPQVTDADEPDDTIEVSSKKPAPAAAKQTRKRKADAEVEAEDGGSASTGTRQKRQARKVAAPKAADDEAAGRRTRSTRAKVGK
ncbi:uncharacterized protein LTR77_005217 [Saxophila tyrrhenica]|uniref:Uncharacterized protein n=1 Tax=Saxophila tyrrhenica TaxID=1690608 RepID=A0AAV9PFE0_9PEZI|nr:hypothetical protein LTR77_005217 [Saxophila tyrrhenica]